MARTTSEKQEKLDNEFRLLCRDMNQAIIHTPEYNYGNFRFRVYQNSRGQNTVLLANVKWHKEYGKYFQKVAHKHGYRLDFDERKGMYYIQQINNKNKNNGKRRITIQSPSS